MKISIIIATYNRSYSLVKMIGSLLAINTDISFDYEIIIIDNNSKDNTKEIVEAFILKDDKVKYFFEAKQGKSYAMNAGINHANGEILAFTDDDVLLDKNWLLNIAHFSLEHDFDALGGKVLPLYPDNTPQWIKDCKDILNGPIVCHDYGETIKVYNDKMLPFVGANIVIKLKVLKELGLFNPLIGVGTGAMGEDTEYFRRLQKANKKIYYNPSVLILHPVGIDRMNLLYFAKWNFGFGIYTAKRMSKRIIEICFLSLVFHGIFIVKFLFFYGD